MPSEITGRLTGVKRLPSSTNGNPRYEITLDDRDTYRTEVDGSVGYEVENYRKGRFVVLQVNRKSVYGMRYA